MWNIDAGAAQRTRQPTDERRLQMREEICGELAEPLHRRTHKIADKAYGIAHDRLERACRALDIDHDPRRDDISNDFSEQLDNRAARP